MTTGIVTMKRKADNLIKSLPNCLFGALYVDLNKDKSTLSNCSPPFVVAEDVDAPDCVCSV